MNGGSTRGRKRRRAKALWFILTVSYIQINHALTIDEHQSISAFRGERGYWKFHRRERLDFFGDRDTESGIRTLKSSGGNEGGHSSTKRSKKSSKSSKKSSSSSSSHELATDYGPMGSFLVSTERGYHLTGPSSPDNTGSMPSSHRGSKSNREPTVAPTKFTVQPSLSHSQAPSLSGAPTSIPSSSTMGPSMQVNPNPSSSPSNGTSIHPSAAPSDPLSPEPSGSYAPSFSQQPTSFMNSSQPTQTPLPSPSGKPSQYPSVSPQPTSNNATSFSPSNSPSSNMTSTSSPSALPSSSASPTTTYTPSISPSTSSEPTRTPTPSASSAPTMVPTLSPRPTSSGQPTLASLLSAFPSGQQSGSPTMTSAPSLTPTVTPGPSVSSEPSVSPTNSPRPSRSSSPTESKSPSSSPTITSRPSISHVPSMVPTKLQPSSAPSRTASSVSVRPSSEPSTHPSSRRTVIPQPTRKPTPGPSTGPVATASPTRFTIKRKIPPFTLEYEIIPFDPPLRSDVSELESVTSAYVRKHVMGAISSDEVVLVDFLTNYVSFESMPGVASVHVTFESAAFFDPLTPIFPTEGEMIAQMLDAFTGAEMAGYVGMVQALPSENTFTSTTQIFLVNTQDAADALAIDQQPPVRRNGHGVPIVITVAAGILLLTSGSAMWARSRRRRKRRREASEKFINGVIGDPADAMSSKVSTAHATDFGEHDNSQLFGMEGSDWQSHDIESTEQGVLLLQDLNANKKKRDKPNQRPKNPFAVDSEKLNRDRPRHLLKRAQIDSTTEIDRESEVERKKAGLTGHAYFDESTKETIEESTRRLLEDPYFSMEGRSEVGDTSIGFDDDRSLCSPVQMTEEIIHEENKSFCESRGRPYFLRAKRSHSIYGSDDTSSWKS